MKSTPLDVFCTGFRCSFCQQPKDQLTIWNHVGPVSTWCAVAKGDIHVPVNRILYLCFRGCQNFPEPFENAGCPLRLHWRRVDHWQDVTRAQPRIRSADRDWRNGPHSSTNEHLQSRPAEFRSRTNQTG